MPSSLLWFGCEGSPKSSCVRKCKKVWQRNDWVIAFTWLVNQSLMGLTNNWRQIGCGWRKWVIGRVVIGYIFCIWSIESLSLLSNLHMTWEFGRQHLSHGNIKEVFITSQSSHRPELDSGILMGLWFLDLYFHVLLLMAL